MASKKHKGTSRRTGSRRARSTANKRYAITSYQISWDPVPDIPENELPPDLAAQIDRLYHLTQSHPRDAIVELKGLIERYPDYPKLFNFLGAAYHSIGDIASAEQVAKHTYQRFPNYLFAKLAYADLCVCKGKFDEIPVIFDGKYDLSQLFPHRKRFHVTEAVGFMGTMGYYFAKQGEIERARPYHKILKELAPDEPQTRRLDRLMELTFFQKVLAGVEASYRS